VAVFPPSNRSPTQGLVAGMGDEVRLGRGFMIWTLTIRLTEEGQRKASVERILEAVYSAIAVSRHACGRPCWGGAQTSLVLIQGALARPPLIQGALARPPLLLQR